MTLDWQPLLLTFRLAAVTTLILFCLGVPFAWWLAHTRIRLKPAVEAMVAVPLVLPPSVLGFYLLLTFSPEHWFGQWLDRVAGLRLAFSFEGLVVASVIFSFPFLVHPVQAGFQNLPASLTEAAYPEHYEQPELRLGSIKATGAPPAQWCSTTPSKASTGCRHGARSIKRVASA